MVHEAAHNGRVQSGLPSGTWDACVLDADQLDRDGYELVRHARETQPNLAVVVGGHDTERTQQVAILAGADEFIDVEGSERLVARRLGLAIAFRRLRSRSHLTAPQCSVLMVDWDQVEAPAVRSALVKSGVAVTQAADPWLALNKLRGAQVNVLLTAPSERVDGVGVAEAALRYDPRLRVIVTSDLPDLADVAGAVGAGACDYLLRPVGPEQAIGAVKRAWSEYADTSPTGQTQPRMLRVLLIEPREAYARLLQQMLAQDSRLWSVVVRDVDQALLRLEERDFDALIYSPDSDRADSLVVMHRLRGRDPRPAMVVLHDSSDASFAERVLRLGAQDAVCKRSLGREALSQRVRNAVRRNRHLLQHERFVRDLQTREASQQEVVRRSVDGLLIVDSRGFVVFANPAAERMFDSPASELLGTQFPYALTDGEPREAQLRKARQPCIAEMTQVSIDWNGAPAHLVAMRDVTERQQAEALRDRLAHAERLAAIGQLAAGVTHEINNPAAYVLANLTTMQDTVRGLLANGELADGEATTQLNELTAMIEENIDGMTRISSITRDLRTFARIDSAEVSLVCLNECVKVACRLAFNEIRHRAHLVQELGDLPSIPASQGKLAQVVTNLLVNAAQAIPEGSRTQQRITVRTGTRPDGVWLRVEDTGRGIPESVRARMFDPFFTTKTRGQGTGLGLALCADIVRQHNGEMRAENGEHGGASVEVLLPYDTRLELRRSRPPARNSMVQRTGATRRRVLIIDDEPLVLRSLKRMLSAHDVVTAASGREALEGLAKDANFDAVFCDLMMPEMDGAAVLAALEAEFPELAEQVVFCSGGAFTRRTKDIVESLRRPLVQKPLTRASFEEALMDLPASRPELRRVEDRSA